MSWVVFDRDQQGEQTPKKKKKKDFIPEVLVKKNNVPIEKEYERKTAINN